MAGVELESQVELCLEGLNPLITDRVLLDYLTRLGSIVNVKRDHTRAKLALDHIQSQARVPGACVASWAADPEYLTPCLAVGNLSGGVTDDVLREAFRAVGAINARIVPAPAAAAVTCGFVWFEHMENAERALALMNSARIGQWPINVAWVSTQQDFRAATTVAIMRVARDSDPDNTYVYVGLLELVRMVKRFGGVHSIARAAALDFAVLRFLQHGAAVASIAHLQGAFMRDRQLTVKWGFPSAAPASPLPVSAAAATMPSVPAPASAGLGPAGGQAPSVGFLGLPQLGPDAHKPAAQLTGAACANCRSAGLGLGRGQAAGPSTSGAGTDGGPAGKGEGWGQAEGLGGAGVGASSRSGGLGLGWGQGVRTGAGGLQWGLLAACPAGLGQNGALGAPITKSQPVTMGYPAPVSPPWPAATVQDVPWQSFLGGSSWMQPPRCMTVSTPLSAAVPSAPQANGWPAGPPAAPPTVLAKVFQVDPPAAPPAVPSASSSPLPGWVQGGSALRAPADSTPLGAAPLENPMGVVLGGDGRLGWGLLPGQQHPNPEPTALQPLAAGEAAKAEAARAAGAPPSFSLFATAGPLQGLKQGSQGEPGLTPWGFKQSSGGGFGFPPQEAVRAMPPFMGMQALSNPNISHI